MYHVKRWTNILVHGLTTVYYLFYTGVEMSMSCFKGTQLNRCHLAITPKPTAHSAQVLKKREGGDIKLKRGEARQNKRREEQVKLPRGEGEKDEKRIIPH